MKKIYILTAIIFLNSIILNAQVEDVLDPTDTGLTGFLLVGDDLYYTQSDDIFKIDITVTSPTPTIIIDGLGEPTGLLLNGNDLYFAQANQIYFVQALYLLLLRLHCLVLHYIDLLQHRQLML